MLTKFFKFIFLSFLMSGVFTTKSNAAISVEVQSKIDSLYKSLSESKHDTDIIRNYIYLTEVFYKIELDSVRVFSAKVINLCEHLLKNNNHKDVQLFANIALANGYNSLGYVNDEGGNIELTLTYYKKALHYARISKDGPIMGWILNNLANLHYNMKNYATAINYLKQSYELAFGQIGQDGGICDA